MLQGGPGEDASEESDPAAKAETRSAGQSLAALWGWMAGPARRFHEHLASDQAFADHVCRSLDARASGLSYLLYTAAAVLIFVINGALYDAS